MQIAFFSNFINHHQLPFCQAMCALTGGSFTFVATKPIPRERLDFGYADMNREHGFVLRAYEGEAEKQKALTLALEADVVIVGSAPWEYFKERLARNKLTFLYYERLYRTASECWKLPVHLWRHFRRYHHKNVYLLCASAYTAYDFARTFTFLGKAYKWGYFPAVKMYDPERLTERKEANTILWAGRFLDLKHPEHAVEIAKRLRDAGYDFSLTMLGNGELLEPMRQKVRQLELEDRVSLPGAVPAEQVRAYMERAEIYLFTSDRAEGWGAVLNESMNSGCAVVASRAIGSVPFLIEEGETGLAYESGNVDQLYGHVKHLLDHPEYRRALGRKACLRVMDLWNARTAAARLVELSEALLRRDAHLPVYKDGPCSEAKILKG